MAEEKALLKKEWAEKEQRESSKVRAEALTLQSALMSYDTSIIELAGKGPLAISIPAAQDPARSKKLEKFHSWFCLPKNEEMRNDVKRRELLAALKDELVREACRTAGLNLFFSKTFDWNNIVVEEQPPPEFDMAEAFGSWGDNDDDALKAATGLSSPPPLDPKRKGQKEVELERAKVFMYWYFSSAAGDARLDFLERRIYITDRATLKLERWRQEGGEDEASEVINVFSPELDELVFSDDIEWMDLPEDERLMEAEAAICDVKVREAAHNSGIELISLAEISYFLFGSIKAQDYADSPFSRADYERKFNAFLDWFPASKARKLFLKREMEAGKWKAHVISYAVFSVHCVSLSLSPTNNTQHNLSARHDYNIVAAATNDEGMREHAAAHTVAVPSVQDATSDDPSNQEKWVDFHSWLVGDNEGKEAAIAKAAAIQAEMLKVDSDFDDDDDDEDDGDDYINGLDKKSSLVKIVAQQRTDELDHGSIKIPRRVSMSRMIVAQAFDPKTTEERQKRRSSIIPGANGSRRGSLGRAVELAHRISMRNLHTHDEHEDEDDLGDLPEESSGRVTNQENDAKHPEIERQSKRASKTLVNQSKEVQHAQRADLVLAERKELPFVETEGIAETRSDRVDSFGDLGAQSVSTDGIPSPILEPRRLSSEDRTSSPSPSSRFRLGASPAWSGRSTPLMRRETTRGRHAKLAHEKRQKKLARAASRNGASLKRTSSHFRSWYQNHHAVRKTFLRQRKQTFQAMIEVNLERGNGIGSMPDLFSRFIEFEKMAGTADDVAMREHEETERIINDGKIDIYAIHRWYSEAALREDDTILVQAEEDEVAAEMAAALARDKAQVDNMMAEGLVDMDDFDDSVEAAQELLSKRMEKMRAAGNLARKLGKMRRRKVRRWEAKAKGAKNGECMDVAKGEGTADLLGEKANSCSGKDATVSVDKQDLDLEDNGTVERGGALEGSAATSTGSNTHNQKDGRSLNDEETLAPEATIKFPSSNKVKAGLSEREKHVGDVQIHEESIGNEEGFSTARSDDSGLATTMISAKEEHQEAHDESEGTMDQNDIQLLVNNGLKSESKDGGEERKDGKEGYAENQTTQKRKGEALGNISISSANEEKDTESPVALVSHAQQHAEDWRFVESIPLDVEFIADLGFVTGSGLQNNDEEYYAEKERLEAEQARLEAEKASENENLENMRAAEAEQRKHELEVQMKALLESKQGDIFKLAMQERLWALERASNRDRMTVAEREAKRKRDAAELRRRELYWEHQKWLQEQGDLMKLEDERSHDLRHFEDRKLKEATEAARKRVEAANVRREVKDMGAEEEGSRIIRERRVVEEAIKAEQDRLNALLQDRFQPHFQNESAKPMLWHPKERRAAAARKARKTRPFVLSNPEAVLKSPMPNTYEVGLTKKHMRNLGMPYETTMRPMTTPSLHRRVMQGRANESFFQGLGMVNQHATPFPRQSNFSGDTDGGLLSSGGDRLLSRAATAPHAPSPLHDVLVGTQHHDNQMGVMPSNEHEDTLSLREYESGGGRGGSVVTFESSFPAVGDEGSVELVFEEEKSGFLHPHASLSPLPSSTVEVSPSLVEGDNGSLIFSTSSQILNASQSMGTLRRKQGKRHKTRRRSRSGSADESGVTPFFRGHFGLAGTKQRIVRRRR